ncbi:MAG: multidrug transporter subunit MdtA, partial [Ferrovum sp.]|nr:multidrug transporter subunit MdtA [Ferrovum sp.]
MKLSISRFCQYKRPRFWIGVLVLGVLAALVFKFYAGSSSPSGGNAASPRRAPLAPVRVAPVITTDFPVWLIGLGTVTPVYTVTVRSMVDG